MFGYKDYICGGIYYTFPKKCLGIDIAWEDTVFVFEALGEIGWSGETDLVGYLGNAHAARFQETMSLCQTSFAKKIYY